MIGSGRFFFVKVGFAALAVVLGAIPAQASSILLHQVVGGAGNFVGDSTLFGFSVDNKLYLSNPDFFDPDAVEYDVDGVYQTVHFFDPASPLTDVVSETHVPTSLIIGYVGFSAMYGKTLQQFLADDGISVFELAEVTFPPIFSEGFSTSVDSKTIAFTTAGRDFFIRDASKSGKNFSGSLFSFTQGIGVASDVPEPISWDLMVAGFGITGGAMRYRKTRVAAA
jgi:hypothetical protein